MTSRTIPRNNIAPGSLWVRSCQINGCVKRNAGPGSGSTLRGIMEENRSARRRGMMLASSDDAATIAALKKFGMQATLTVVDPIYNSTVTFVDLLTVPTKRRATRGRPDHAGALPVPQPQFPDL